MKTRLNQNIDEEGNTYIYVKPWYKKWWLFSIIIFVLLIIIVLKFNRSDNTVRIANDVTSISKNKTKTLAFDLDDYQISKALTYKLKYQNNSWSGGSFKVYRVTIYKTKKSHYYETGSGKIRLNGFVRIYLTAHAKKNINVDISDGVVNLSTMELQHVDDSDDYWSGNMNKGATKNIEVTAPIEKLNKLTNIKKVALHFDVAAKSTDDDSLDKTMNLVLNLIK